MSHQINDSGQTSHGYTFPPYEPYNGYGYNHHRFPSFAGNTSYGGSSQMMNTVGLQNPNDNVYLQQPYQTIPATQAIKGCHFYYPHTFGATNGQGKERFTCYAPNQRRTINFSRVPRHGDVFRSRLCDNALFLDFVSKGDPQQQHLSGYSKDTNLYRVHEENGVFRVQRMGDDILTFHEENKTATYYLPDKDIALHFTRVPRDGDIFSSQRNDNVLILEIVPKEDSQEHHNMHPCHRDLYKVCEKNGGYSLMKMDNVNIPSEESYFLGGVTQEEDNTFTFYLGYKDMVCHFTRLPTHGDVFRSCRKNNIMILDVCPGVDFQKCPTPPRHYGSPWNTDLYLVQQTEDGFELVTITGVAKSRVAPEDIIRRELKIRRYIASSMSSVKDNNKCALCRAAYKDFDRVGGIECGHEYHVGCLIPWLLGVGSCPICGKRFSPKDER